MPARVAIARADRIAEAVTAALAPLDLAGLVRDRYVAVKPNDTWATSDDTTGVTRGDTLDAVLASLLEAGPRRLVVSGGAGAAETEDVLRVSGMLDAARRHGVEVVDHNRPPFEEVALDHGPERSVKVNRRVLEYEVLVSLAQLKMHDSATVTLCLKNVAMSYPAADWYGHPRGSYAHEHAFFEDLHGFIAAMARRFPIHLGIIAGHPAMIATGPLGGKTVETGLVVASRDPLAADVVGARLLGFRPMAVRHIWEAGRLGVGETDLSRIEVVGLPLEAAIRHFTQAAYGQALTYEHA
ncbi:MAG TPA: DUF362 domain-containing protein [Thermodesulfobacteriota bacterium]